MNFQTGNTVTWTWGNGSASGTIKQIYTDKVTKTIKGTEVIRNASNDDPAYLVEQDDGDRVLKAARKSKLPNLRKGEETWESKWPDWVVSSFLF